MSTTEIQTATKVLTDGTAIFSTTADGDFYWLTQGVLAAQKTLWAVLVQNTAFSAQIDGQLFGFQRAIYSTAAGTTITIGDTGSVRAVANGEVAAIELVGGSAQLVNAGSIFSQSGFGVSIAGTNNHILNSGHVFGSTGGVLVSPSVGMASTLINTGTIEGGRLDQDLFRGNGVFIQAENMQVANSGVIAAVAAEGAGIGLGLGAGGTIRNFATGLIQSAQFWGIDGSALIGGSFTVINRGHIEGADGSVRGGAAGMTLRNLGTLGGDMDLGLGTATFDNHGTVDGNVTEAGATTTLRNFGLITGNVALGAGADLFINRGTVEGDVRLGNDGGTFNTAAGHVLGTIFGGKGVALIIGSAEDDVIDISAFTSRSISAGDEVRGGAGADLITAGNGRDLFFGGAGADVFKFNSTFGAGTTAPGSDTIKDFAHGVDDIDLSAFMAGAAFIGNATFTGHLTKEVRYVAGTGLILGDVDGNGSADWFLHVKAQTVLTAADFLF